jgi:hypothetical protein
MEVSFLTKIISSDYSEMLKSKQSSVLIQKNNEYSIIHHNTEITLIPIKERSKKRLFSQATG